MPRSADVFTGFAFRSPVNDPPPAWTTPLAVLLRDFIRPGDAVLDVGIGAGVEAAHLAALVGKRGAIHAFEANPYLIPYALDALQTATGADRFRLSNAVVGDREAGHVPVTVASRYAVDLCRSGHARVRQEGRARIEVAAVTLDAYCRTRRLAPAAIIVHAAASAPEIIGGADGVLRRHRPVVLIAGGVPSRAAIVRSLEDTGYAVYDGISYLRLPSSASVETGDLAPGVLVAMPAGRGRKPRRGWTSDPVVEEHLAVELRVEAGADGDRLESDFSYLAAGRWILRCDRCVTGHGPLVLAVSDAVGIGLVERRLSARRFSSAGERIVVLEVASGHAVKVVVRPLGRSIRVAPGTLTILKVTLR